MRKSISWSKEEQKAIDLFGQGKQYSVSTFIDEDTITAGYGQLDDNGLFEFPLPKVYIKQIYGTTSWREKLQTS